VTIDAPGQPRSQVFRPGDVIVRQGESGDCMYVVESGKVEVVQERNGSTVRLAEGGPGDFFGEMAIFQRQERSATVRAVAATRVRVARQGDVSPPGPRGRVARLPHAAEVSQRVRRSNAELARSLARLSGDPHVAVAPQ